MSELCCDVRVVIMTRGNIMYLNTSLVATKIICFCACMHVVCEAPCVTIISGNRNKKCQLFFLSPPPPPDEMAAISQMMFSYEFS